MPGSAGPRQQNGSRPAGAGCPGAGEAPGAAP